jgi:hypothetical protein
MWVTSVYRDVAAGVKYDIAMEEFDCAHRTSAVIIGQTYSPSGSTLSSLQPSPPSYVIPGTVGEMTLRHACASFDEWGGNALQSVALPPESTVQSYADTIVFHRSAVTGSAGLAGNWGLNGDCSSVLRLADDGTFSTSGNHGTWSVLGVYLHFVDSKDGAYSALIQAGHYGDNGAWIADGSSFGNASAMRLTFPDGSSRFEVRC